MFYRKHLTFIVILFSAQFVCSAQNQEWKLSITQSPSLGISCARFTPDGKYLATGSSDGNLKLWEISSKRVIHDIKAHKSSLTSLLYTNDGSRIITGSEDGTVKVWDILTGDLSVSIDCYPDGVKTVEIGQGETILTVPFSVFSTVKFWDIDTGDEIGALQDISINSASIGPEDHIVISNSRAYGIDYWNSEKDPFIQPLSGFPLINRRVFTISSDRKFLAIIDQNGPYPQYIDVGISIIDEDSLTLNEATSELSRTSRSIPYYPSTDTSGSPFLVPVQALTNKISNLDLAVIDEHLPVEIVNLEDLSTRKTSIRRVLSASFSPDNKRLLTTDIKGRVKLWDIENDHLEFSFPKHKGKFDTLRLKTQTIARFSPNGEYIFIYSSLGKANLWDARTLTPVLDISDVLNEKIESIDRVDALNEIDQIAFNKESTLLALWEYNNLYVLNLKSYDIESFNAEITEMESAKLSRSGRRLITSTGSRTNQLWNLDDLTFEEINGLSIKEDAVFSPTREILATISGVGPPTIRDLENNTKLELKGHSGLVTQIRFDNSGRRVLTCSFDGTAIVWDVKSGELVYQLSGHTNKVIFGEFSHKGDMIVTTSMDGTAKLWDGTSGKMLKMFKANAVFRFAHFSYDDRYLLTSSSFGLRLWDIQSGRELQKFETQNIINTAAFHPNGKMLLAAGSDKIIRGWSLADGEEVLKIRAHEGSITDIKISPDKKSIATISTDGDAKIWNSGNFSLISFLNGHNGSINDLNYSYDGQSVVTASNDGTARFWDVSSGKELVTLYNLQDKWYDPIEGQATEYMWIESINNYYHSSTSAARKLYFKKNLSTLSFDQLDIKYNRPDKVLAAIGSKDSSLIQAYKEAYVKRVQKLGIDTLAYHKGFSLPKAEILNIKEVGYNQTQESLRLNLFFEDSVRYLDRINILINGVPFYGSSGINLSNRRTNRFDTTVVIPLSDGRNLIEASCANINGISSYRSSLHVYYDSQSSSQSKLYFIGLGIDHFKQADYDLSYSVKDIRDLATAFKDKFKSRCEVDTFLNQNITIQNIREVKKKLLKTHVDDRIIISYSGHGLLGNNLDYYLSTYDTNFESPEKGGLPYQELENLLDSIPARRKLLLIDACHSGLLDNEVIESGQSTEQNTPLYISNVKGAKDVSNTGFSKNSAFQLMETLFANVSNDIGATVVSAAGGAQFAIEKNGNGVFTYSILEFMKYKRSSYSVQGLKAFVSKNVRELTNGLQQPTSRKENHQYDWVLWY